MPVCTSRRVFAVEGDVRLEMLQNPPMSPILKTTYLHELHLLEAAPPETRFHCTRRESSSQQANGRVREKKEPANQLLVVLGYDSGPVAIKLVACLSPFRQSPANPLHLAFLECCPVDRCLKGVRVSRETLLL